MIQQSTLERALRYAFLSFEDDGSGAVARVRGCHSAEASGKTRQIALQGLLRTLARQFGEPESKAPLQDLLKLPAIRDDATRQAELAFVRRWAAPAEGPAAEFRSD